VDRGGEAGRGRGDTWFQRLTTARLYPHGVRWRLTAWVAVVLLLSSALTFVAIYRGTGSQLRRETEREVASDASVFARHLIAARGSGTRALAAASSAYVHAQPFRASSRLLFAVLPGGVIVTNEPELLGDSEPDNGESAAEQQAENRLARRLLHAGNGYSTVQVPDVGDLRLLIRTVPIPGQSAVRIGVGEPLAPVHRAQVGVLRAFLLAGAIVLLLALVASYLVGARVSRPLRRMARIAARVDGGDLAPRIESTTAPGDEVQVLADAFDHMLDRLADAFARQRSFVSDASHELRTPLTVIRGQLEVLARQQSPSLDEVRRVERLVAGEVSRMSRLVDELLVLAHSDETEFVQLRELVLEDYVQELWQGIAATADRQFELAIAVQGTLCADPDRLAQALRNLLRNAIEHTRPGSGRVRLTVGPVGGERLRFTVEDDGPGIPPEQREQIFDRFHRTDAARDRAIGGSGLGLAIVKAVAVAHGGSVTASASELLGGARLELELADFRRGRTPARAHRSPEQTPGRSGNG
jgi:two-component system OmpR family sensor kinase